MNYEELRAEKMAALKAKDSKKNSVVTMLLSGMTYKRKELGRELTEDECFEVINKELKQVKEALAMSKGREEAEKGMQEEIAILESYLPKQMSAEEVEGAIVTLVEKLGLEKTLKNKGLIMKNVMAELKGKADGKLIGTIVDSMLS